MYRSRIIILSKVFFIAASCSPALTFQVFSGNGFETFFGFHILLIGWLGIAVEQFGWFANPLGLIGINMAAKDSKKAARILLGIAFLIALTSLTLFGKRLPHDEGGTTTMLFDSFEIGFYLWLASIITAFLATFVKVK